MGRFMLTITGATGLWLDEAAKPPPALGIPDFSYLFAFQVCAQRIFFSAPLLRLSVCHVPRECTRAVLGPRKRREGISIGLRGFRRAIVRSRSSEIMWPGSVGSTAAKGHFSPRDLSFLQLRRVAKIIWQPVNLPHHLVRIYCKILTVDPKCVQSENLDDI